MEISRRRFTQGLAAVAGNPAPNAGIPLPAESDAGDAYDRLLMEYFRVEEAARTTDRAGSAAGPLSWEGRHLEDFIASLDQRVDLPSTAAEIYRSFRASVKRCVEREASACKALPEPDPHSKSDRVDCRRIENEIADDLTIEDRQNPAVDAERSAPVEPDVAIPADPGRDRIS